MPTMQIKHVPDDVHRVFRTRAAKAGQSLQEYMLNVLTETASHPTVEELFERVAQRSGGGVTAEFAVRVLREERARHDPPDGREERGGGEEREDL
jgi:antitoxin FitA